MQAVRIRKRDGLRVPLVIHPGKAEPGHLASFG